MISIFKSNDVFHLVDDHQTNRPFVYDDIKALLEDLEFLLEDYINE